MFCVAFLLWRISKKIIFWVWSLLKRRKCWLKLDITRKTKKLRITFFRH